MSTHHRTNSPRRRRADDRRLRPHHWERVCRQKEDELADLRVQLAKARRLLTDLQAQVPDEEFVGLIGADPTRDVADDSSDNPYDNSNRATAPEAVAIVEHPDDNPQPSDAFPIDDDEDFNALADPLADEGDLGRRLAAAEARADAAERRAADALALRAEAAGAHAAMEATAQSRAAHEAYLHCLIDLDRRYGGDLRADAITQANDTLAAMGYGPENLPPADLVRDRLEIAYLREARLRDQRARDQRPNVETLDTGVGGNATALCLEGSLEDVIADMKRAGKLR